MPTGWCAEELAGLLLRLGADDASMAARIYRAPRSPAAFAGASDSCASCGIPGGALFVRLLCLAASLREFWAFGGRGVVPGVWGSAFLFGELFSEVLGRGWLRVDGTGFDTYGESFPIRATN